MTEQNTPWWKLEAPRYTSYPSAQNFNNRVGPDDYSRWLSEMNGASLSAYVHIPFCREMCWFCGCNTKLTHRYEPISKYVRLLLKEIEMVRSHMGGDVNLVNVHFGGGSPSLLEEAELMAILYAITSTFGNQPTGEQAIELDPRTTTRAMIDSYLKFGFNRVSMGIQDFNAEVQEAINRIQPYTMIEELMRSLRTAGMDKINFDLIYGLPHQNIDNFRYTLEKTIELEPSRIALFSYAHVPHMKKHQRMIDTAALPAENEKLELYELGCSLLEKAGYVAIGIDHFAKADDELTLAMRDKSMKRNFQGYVTYGTDALIGLGNSAISQMPQGYAQNSANMPEYRASIEKCELPTVRGCPINAEDVIRKRAIDELMCFMETDVDEQKFATELAELAKPRYGNIVAIKGGNVRITTSHRMAARVVASIFDQYMSASARYSKVA